MLGMDSLPIGALAPLTAPGWVAAGRQLLAGLELGVRDVNAAGGVDGRPLELVIRDTAGDPARAAAAVDGLAALGVAALAGEYHSVVARAVAARAEALGLPFLCSSAVLDALTDQESEWVARIAPPQSRGWRVFADHLRAAGHTRIAVAAQPSVYWATGTRILREHVPSIVEIDPEAVVDELVREDATALLLLVGAPEPAASIVAAVRREPRLADVLVGAPAGQPELAEWLTTLGAAGAGIPFLRYLPKRLGPLGDRVAPALGEGASFVAYEGYDTIVALAERLRTGAPWPNVAVEGTRGTIRFSREPGISVWQWAGAPIQVVDRDPTAPERFRVLA